MANIAVLYSAVSSDAEVLETSSSEEPPQQADPDPLQPGHLKSRLDNAVVARRVASALVSRGHKVTLGAVWDRVPVARLRGMHAVVNLLEHLADDSSREAEAAQQLLDAGIPFSGNAPAVLRACQRKEVCRETLRDAGVSVPEGLTLREVPSAWPEGLPVGRVIVKPAHEDASEGIDARAVVDGLGPLREAVARVVEGMRQPALVERYVEGRELTASLLGFPVRVLPLGEIDFSTMPAGLPHIVTYAAKWEPNSAEYACTPSVECRLDAATTARVGKLARATAGALGLTDVARLDLRLDAQGNVYVIDVNPNCDLGPDAGFAKAAARAGMSYGEMLEGVLARALKSRAQQLSLGA